MASELVKGAGADPNFVAHNVNTGDVYRIDDLKGGKSLRLISAGSNYPTPIVLKELESNKPDECLEAVS